MLRLVTCLDELLGVAAAAAAVASVASVASAASAALPEDLPLKLGLGVGLGEADADEEAAAAAAAAASARTSPTAATLVAGDAERASAKRARVQRDGGEGQGAEPAPTPTPPSPPPAPSPSSSSSPQMPASARAMAAPTGTTPASPAPGALGRAGKSPGKPPRLAARGAGRAGHVGGSPRARYKMDNVVARLSDASRLEGGAALRGAGDMRGAVLVDCPSSSGTSALPAELRPDIEVIVRPGAFPFDPLRMKAYTAAELYSADDLDARIYASWKATSHGAPPTVSETLARAMHDASMGAALNALVDGRRVVGFFGGHRVARTAPEYRACVELGRRLAQAGFVVASGGGPGIMEAALLGAACAAVAAPAEEGATMDEALRLLGRAPVFTDAEWLEQGQAALALVEARIPGGRSRPLGIGVPTWFYGHEPSNVFATHIFKYFDVGLREAALVHASSHGMVFFPGSAGTYNEVFMGVVENHYKLGKAGVSPIVFFSAEDTHAAIPLLMTLAQGHEYADYVWTSDDPEDIARKLESVERKKAEANGALL